MGLVAELAAIKRIGIRWAPRDEWTFDSLPLVDAQLEASRSTTDVPS